MEKLNSINSLEDDFNDGGYMVSSTDDNLKVVTNVNNIVTSTPVPEWVTQEDIILDLPKNYSYKPLPSQVTVFKSNIEGLGLFSTAPIPRDKNLGRSHYKVSSTELLRTALGRFVNHSLIPNCIIKEIDNNSYYLITLKALPPGEELTVNYYNSDCANEVFGKQDNITQSDVFSSF